MRQNREYYEKNKDLNVRFELIFQEMLDRKSIPNKFFNESMIGGKVQLDLDEKNIFNNGGFISRNQTLYKCMVGSLLWLFNLDNSSNI